MKLYRYTDLSCRKINSLRKNQLWLSAPKTFNDPFDCNFDIFPPKENHLNRPLIGPGNQILDPPAGDELGFWERLIQSTQSDFQETGICCFSERWDSILMWSHYANRHHGICIEYTGTDAEFDLFAKVRYSSHRPAFSIHGLTSDLDKTINDYLLTKHVDWYYEKEWRMVHHRKQGAIPSPVKITSVIFGMKTNEQNREKVKRIIGTHVNYFLTQRHPTEFGIEKIPC